MTWWVLLILLLGFVIMKLSLSLSRKRTGGRRYFRSGYREHWKER